MTTYLEKFQSTISNNQYNKLVQLLDQKKRQGEFETIEQFRDRLNTLMGELFNKRISPLLSLFKAIPSMEIDSETYNFMLRRIQDDLEIAFIEALNIDEVLRGHQTLVHDVVFRNLKHALADLQTKVELQELIVSSPYGFSKSLASNFTGVGSARLQRVAQTGGYFTDPRIGDAVPVTYDAPIDHIGKYLTLPCRSTGYVPIVNVRQIFDSEAIATAYDVEPDGMTLQNIIDDTVGTYWARVYLFSNDTQTEVTTKLELDLGGAQEVNFIEIEPALLRKVVLESITYIKGDGSSETMLVGEEIEHHRAKVQFRKIAACKLILKFVNENFVLANYNVESNEETLSDVLSSAVANQLNISNIMQEVNFSGRQFQIGFDNIRVGLSTYRDRGIFISTPLDLQKAVRLLGLKSVESRPAASTDSAFFITPIEDTYNDTDDSQLFYGSVEYWCIRNSFDSNDRLISSDMFPILPFGVQRINHERLLLTHHYSNNTLVNDAGRLMFYTTELDGNIKVFRNGIELAHIDLESEGDGWLIEERLCLSSPNSGRPMKIGIRLSQPRAGDLYTVSYNPIVSNIPLTSIADGATHQRVIDLVGDNTVRSFEDQVVLCSEVKNALPINRSEIYLMIVLRRNTADVNLSPTVNSFTVVSGTKELSKFQG